MSIHRSEAHRSIRAGARLVAFSLLALGAVPALASPRPSPRSGVYTSDRSAGAFVPDRTGSLRVSPYGGGLRSMSSATLGNAEFPEREPIAQNLGNTSGGGLN